MLHAVLFVSRVSSYTAWIVAGEMLQTMQKEIANAVSIKCSTVPGQVVDSSVINTGRQLIGYVWLRDRSYVLVQGRYPEQTYISPPKL